MWIGGFIFSGDIWKLKGKGAGFTTKEQNMCFPLFNISDIIPCKIKRLSVVPMFDLKPVCAFI